MEELVLRNKLNLGNTKFGIEIEFDEANFDNVCKSIENGINYKLEKKHDYTHWRVDTDNSVTKGSMLGLIGGEAISPILSDTYECYKDIEEKCNIIKVLGGETSDSTAAHIHINGDIIENSEVYLYNLIKLWIAYEDIIYKFSYNGDRPRKPINSFASPMYTFLCEINNLEKCRSLFDMLEIICGDDRNYALNFRNYRNAYKGYSAHKNTIEVRCPNGTLDPVVWQNNINFFVKLFLYAKSDRYDNKVVEKAISNFNFPKHYNNAPWVFSLIDEEKAIELSNLIFEDETDKVYFLKQYKR